MKKIAPFVVILLTVISAVRLITRISNLNENKEELTTFEQLKFLELNHKLDAAKFTDLSTIDSSGCSFCILEKDSASRLISLKIFVDKNTFDYKEFSEMISAHRGAMPYEELEDFQADTMSIFIELPEKFLYKLASSIIEQSSSVEYKKEDIFSLKDEIKWTEERIIRMENDIKEYQKLIDRGILEEDGYPISEEIKSYQEEIDRLKTSLLNVRHASIDMILIKE